MQQPSTTSLFPKLQNVFVTRLLLQFLTLPELFSNISLLCHAGFELAYDCSLISSLSLNGLQADSEFEDYL